ncbi:MAG: cytochrome c, partial [Deltaproteobacteria bacterium]|nr:cytochrome c [Deltaproteobacteria bacterium]
MRSRAIAWGFVGLVSASIVGVACDENGAVRNAASTASTSTTSAGGGGPTYHGDIAPLLAEHCVTCHESGGIGPFPLDNYADVASAAALVKKVTGSRTMPPFLADNSDECHTFD